MQVENKLNVQIFCELRDFGFLHVFIFIPSLCHAFLGAEYLGIDELVHKQIMDTMKISFTNTQPGGDCNWLSFFIFSESYEENRRNQNQEARPSH